MFINVSPGRIYARSRTKNFTLGLCSKTGAKGKVRLIVDPALKDLRKYTLSEMISRYLFGRGFIMLIIWPKGILT